MPAFESDLVEALGLTTEAKPLVAIVGGGGKTSLLFALGDRLPGRVVLSTTTRIFAAQMERASERCTTDDAGWARHLDGFAKSLLVVGAVEGERAVGVAPELPGQWRARPDVDGVVVEADGSRMRPIKAPAEHEPVIPPETDVVVAVAGIDALGAPIAEVAHRPERVARITGLAPEARLSPEAAGALLASPEGGCKALPAEARAVVLLNKVETDAQRDAAEVIAASALASGPVERVVFGALARPDAGWQVRSRGGGRDPA